jgi:DNA-binding transcriptional LysR family regulator
MNVEARLRALAAFARQRSFSAAAQELRISQPAVSKHIGDLERAFSVRLVDRRPRNSALTPAGTFLANHVLRAEALLAQATRGLAEFRESRAGVLTIVAAGVTGTYVVPEVVAAFHAARPGVKVRLDVATSSVAVERLRGHRAEVGIVGGFAAAPEIEAEPLMEDEIVIIGTPRLAATRPGRRTLEGLTWISREEGSASRAAVEAAWADLGMAPGHRIELPSWEAVKTAVRGGYGVSGCSRLAVNAELRTKTLALIPLRGWRVRRTISILTLRDAVPTPSAQEFVTMLKARWGRTSARR